METKSKSTCVQPFSTFKAFKQLFLERKVEPIRHCAQYSVYVNFFLFQHGGETPVNAVGLSAITGDQCTVYT